MLIVPDLLIISSKSRFLGEVRHEDKIAIALEQQNLLAICITESRLTRKLRLEKNVVEPSLTIFRAIAMSDET